MDILQHYGTPRHSGRYPWGSGDNPYQHNAEFLRKYREMHAKGMSDPEIAEAMGFGPKGSAQLRRLRSIAANNNRKDDIAYALKLKAHGYSDSEIGRRMGRNESSIRSLLTAGRLENANRNDLTAQTLRDNIKTKRYIDVGDGVELQIGVKRETLKTAIEMLKQEGYHVYYDKVTQLGTGKNTSLMVLCAPDVTWTEMHEHQAEIGMIDDRMDPNTNTFRTALGIKPPVSLDSKRIQIRYGDVADENGITGKDMDGIIQLRRGVEDISLGESTYAQVRIAVDGKYFLKGMAIYSDDLPDGIDIRFNTNKSHTKPLEEVLKPMKDDPDNPFGASIMANGQREYIDPVTGEKKQSVINKVNEEGSWEDWRRTLASQMLSKQPEQLIRQQLALTYRQKAEEFEEIKALTNPVIKRELLVEFADECDGTAVDLKAAALPRQQCQVIIPIPSLKDNEIYAPNFLPGETVVCIRYPHGGRFEIPELIVNNNNQEGLSVLGNSRDAVGINAHVAQKLSGADFDGDSVVVIPNNNHAIKTSVLPELNKFDPQESYPKVPGMKVMSEGAKQRQMGIVSNLITDMTLQGAPPEELVRAVKHSMVVIDAPKHELNYLKSERDQGIAELKAKYQKGGASTLISRAGRDYRVPEFEDTGKFDPETGEKITRETGRWYTDKKTGKQVQALTLTTEMAYRKDARELSSGTKQEELYAEFANACKALANQARKETFNLPEFKYDKVNAKKYPNEIADLKKKVTDAAYNAPYERQAQRVANKTYYQKLDERPGITKAEQKKLKGQALSGARYAVGAGKPLVTITDKEWAAIQDHAVSQSFLKEVIRYSDKNVLKTLATPKTSSVVMTESKIALAKAMLASGHSTAEVANRFGVSTSTIGKAVRGELDKKGED